MFLFFVLILSFTLIVFSCILFNSCISPNLQYGSEVWGAFITSKRPDANIFKQIMFKDTNIMEKLCIFVFVSKFWEFIPNHPIMPVEQNWGECILPIIFLAILLNTGTVCVQLMKLFS